VSKNILFIIFALYNITQFIKININYNKLKNQMNRYYKLNFGSRFLIKNYLNRIYIFAPIFFFINFNPFDTDMLMDSVML
jgi:hypothetical protein